MNDRALEYEYLNNLCAQYNLPRIRLRIITNNDIVFDEYLYNVFALHPGHRACFVSEDPYGLFEPIIFIRDDLLDQIFENALRHEFRHYWQYIYHK